MSTIEIHKFGGGVLADGSGLERAAQIASLARKQAQVVVVAAALAGVTDELGAAVEAAAQGEREQGLARLEELLARHAAALDALGSEPATGEALALLGQELEDLLRGVALVGELSARTRDRALSAGEKLSARLLATALGREGTPARAFDADRFLETDDCFGQASPLRDVADRLIAGILRRAFESGEIPVVTGFSGRAPDGATTTLGRGGADLTATLIAAALAANRVVIWTDVGGMYSADPRIVPEARIIPELHYREAAEMSFYGARVLHPRALIPVASRRIPVEVRSGLDPGRPGTRIEGRVAIGPTPVKAISAVRDQALLSIEGNGMSGLPGVAARVFGALAARAISVTMISQSSSEATICLAVPAALAGAAEAALRRDLQPDLTRADVDEIAVERGVGLIAAVGLGMAHTPGVAARLFAALGRRDINVLAIAQGSSELSISVAVAGARVDEAVSALHAELVLS